MRSHIKIEWHPSKKQLIAFDLLEDNETTELFYGGAAGGGKTYLGCVWIIYCSLKYPGSRWLIGRAILKSLKESTLLTFFEICREWGLAAGKNYKYNSLESVIKFENGSEVYLKDLFAYPSDPEFDKFGSTEYTGVFIDEGSQITGKAKNIVMSRIRYKLEEFNLIPKLFIASNPSKNFLYYDFYKHWKDNSLPLFRKFIPALVQDNPFISKHYIENLKKLDKVSKERLLYGNFEYDDDPAKLFEYDDIIDLFTNSVEETDVKYFTVDVARFGSDRTVLVKWQGFFIYEVIVLPISSTKQVRELIEKEMAKDKVPRSRVVIDEDGVGGGVVDELPGVKGFVNNSRAILNSAKPETGNYANLKSQCYFYLADLVAKSKIGVFPDIDVNLKEQVIEELEQIKRKDVDKDGKLAVIGKDVIKDNLGRSPDLADALMMRCLFELKPKAIFSFV